MPSDIQQAFIELTLVTSSFLWVRIEAYKEIILMSPSILKFPSKKISEYLSYAPLCVECNLQKISAGIQQTFIEYLVKMKNLKRLVFGVSFLQLERLTSGKNKIFLAHNSNYLAMMKKRISLVRCACVSQGNFERKMDS